MRLKTRHHARTGLTLSQFGFGGTPLGTLVRTEDAAAAVAMVDVGFASGINYFDVAPFYGSGLAEHRMGTAMIGRSRDDYILSTKVGRLLRPGRGAEAVRLIEVNLNKGPKRGKANDEEGAQEEAA